MSFEILPECYADTLLIKIMEYEKPNHCPSIGEVSNRMQKSYQNRLAIGVVDKDKPGNIPCYFLKFTLLVTYADLELKWHPESKHFLIVIAPALERWLITTAEELDVDFKKYGFKNTKELMNQTKDLKAEDNQNLKQFMNTIKQKKDSPLKTMAFWIDLLLETKGDITKIKAALGLE